MSVLAWLVVAVGIFFGGFGAGVRWHAGEDAIQAKAADDARAEDQHRQHVFGDRVAIQDAQAVAALNTKLGKAYAQIARLSGRPCLDPGTVGVLNATGVPDDGRAPAGQPASAPAAAGPGASNGTGLRVSTDRDVAGYIAYCRTEYGKVKRQLDDILDIQDQRHPLAPP